MKLTHVPLKNVERKRNVCIPIQPRHIPCQLVYLDLDPCPSAAGSGGRARRGLGGIADGGRGMRARGNIVVGGSGNCGRGAITPGKRAGGKVAGGNRCCAIGNRCGGCTPTADDGPTATGPRSSGDVAAPGGVPAEGFPVAAFDDDRLLLRNSFPQQFLQTLNATGTKDVDSGGFSRKRV